MGGGTHYVVGGSGFDYPMDLGFAAQPAWLDFIATSNIKSIRTTRRCGIMCPGSPSGGIDDALQIEMFTGLTGTGTMGGEAVVRSRRVHGRRRHLQRLLVERPQPHH